MGRRTPQSCANMQELRAEIDALDRELVALLAQRARYIDRAAGLKPGARLPARIEARVEEVVARVKVAAEAEALDPDLAEMLWRQLIDWSIAREERAMDAASRRAPATRETERRTMDERENH